MFWIIILLILVCINLRLIRLIWEKIMMRVMIINIKVQFDIVSFHF
ncbi:hypothetical protein Goshw_005878 [Gossypium schwendimanii]|uniref:Uncharacterized protein n=1 Tax=Gossypium schwendimanii TaxID=34291 RepID=A0A7J9NB33_GOSSC|nr:hypothetical protein [Gossypium schwendimanii]